MVVDHLGVVVSKIEEAIPLWARLFGYTQLTDPVINTRQSVRVVFLAKEGSVLIKLVEPTAETSPAFKFAQKGGGLHHICFRCENVEVEVGLLKSMGLRVLSEPQPGEAFDNEKIAFIYAQNGLNIELIDTDKKAGLLNKS